MKVRKKLGWLALGVALATAAWASGCGSNRNSGYPSADGGDGTGGGRGFLPVGPGGDAGEAGDASYGPRLVITPANPVLTVAAGGSPVTQQFIATEPNNSAFVAASWSIDNVALGIIDKSGLFTASGTVGGQATISALFGTAVGSTTVTVRLTASENPGSIDAAKLSAAGALSSSTWVTQ